MFKCLEVFIAGICNMSLPEKNSDDDDEDDMMKILMRIARTLATECSLNTCCRIVTLLRRSSDQHTD